MKILGAIADADYELLKSLLSYSSFDRFDLFCMSHGLAQDFADKLKADDSIPDAAKQKIALFLYDSLKEQFKTTSYYCFYSGESANCFNAAIYLRNAYAKEAFPVTAIIRPLDIDKIIYSNAQEYDSVFCASGDWKKAVRKKYNGKLSCLPLGYDSSLDDKTDKTLAKKAMDFDEDAKHILCLGRISPSSKADLYPLLLVFKSLKEKSDFKIKIVLAGGVSPGELRVHKEIIHELELDFDVILTVNFDEKKKKALISSADVCVAPSDNVQETFGISIIEAAACGIPVVAADIDGYKDLVVQNETGFKIKTTWIDRFEPCETDNLYDISVMRILLAQTMVIDCEEMEEKIRLLLTDDALRKKMGENAAKRAVENYHWDTVIKQYEKEWSSLKNLALKIGKPKDFMSNPYSNNYLKTFSHYPTRIFNENLILQLTPDGENAAKRIKSIPSFYGDVSIMLDPDYLMKVIGYLLQNGRACVKEIFMKFPDENTKGRFTILWAAKYRLIRFVEWER